MHSPFITAALQAAEAASAVIRTAYRGNFAVRYKGDASPVTEVDIAAETTIRAVLKTAFPMHGFYGEELGKDASGAEYLWLIDPIDGTKAFIRGYPVFSIQIALMHNGELIAGVSCAPCWNGGLGETLWAEKGAGAWLDGEQITVSKVAEFEQAILSTGNLASLTRSTSWERLGRLIPALYRVRGYGDFLHYHWLAGGRLDAVIESDVNILDVAALSVIVHEAGGVFTDLAGQQLSLATTSVLAATPALHAKLHAALNYTGAACVDRVSH